MGDVISIHDAFDDDAENIGDVVVDLGVHRDSVTVRLARLQDRVGLLAGRVEQSGVSPLLVRELRRYVSESR